MRRNCIVLIITISIFLLSAHDHRSSQSLHEWFNAIYLCFCLGCKYFLGFACTLYPSLPEPPWLPPPPFLAFLVWKCLSSFPSLNPFFLLFSVCYLRFLLSLSCERFYSLESLFPWFPCRQAVKAAALWGAGQGWAVVVRVKEREPFTGLTDLLLSPRAEGQYPTSQLTGQLSRGELEHREYQTAGCYRQYTNSMSVLSKSLATHAVCTVSSAQNIHIQVHANLLDKWKPKKQKSYRPFLQA